MDIVFFILFFSILLSPFFFALKLFLDSRRKKGQKTIKQAVDSAASSKKLTSSNLTTLLLSSFGLGFVSWYFLKPGNLGIQTLLLTILFSGLALATTDLFKVKIPRYTALLFVASIICVSFIAFRASPSLIVLNVMAGISCVLLALLSLSSQPFLKMTIADYAESWILPLASLPGLSGLTYAFGKLVGTKAPRSVKMNKEILIGVTVALPLLVIFTILFASADSTFSSLLPSLDFSSWEISPALVGALVTTNIVGLFVASLLFYVFILSDRDKKHASHSKKTRHFSKTSALVVLTSVVALFAIFGAIQLPIVFGSDVLADNATLSENARRGFGQLVFASVIVFGLLAFIEHFVPKKDVDSRFKGLSLALVVLTFVVLASAFVRLLATEAEFGFTLPRFYGHSYMIILGVWLALLAVKMVNNLSWSHFATMVAISAFGYVLVINVINPDQLIARTNINRASIREVDTRYLETLSPDAWPAIETGIKNGVFTQEETQELITASCRKNRSRLGNTDWRAWNKAHRDHTEAMKQYSDYEYCP